MTLLQRLPVDVRAQGMAGRAPVVARHHPAQPRPLRHHHPRPPPYRAHRCAPPRLLALRPRRRRPRGPRLLTRHRRHPKSREDAAPELHGEAQAPQAQARALAQGAGRPREAPRQRRGGAHALRGRVRDQHHRRALRSVPIQQWLRRAVVADTSAGVLRALVDGLEVRAREAAARAALDVVARQPRGRARAPGGGGDVADHRGVPGGHEGAVGGQGRARDAGAAEGAPRGGRRLVSISFCFPIFPHRSLYLPGTILNGASFLNDVERVATTEYEPSDDDIVRARLRTMGVQEHRFLFERGTSSPLSSAPSPSATPAPAPASSPAHPKPTLTSAALSLLGAESGHEWLMYDVGGTRSLRAAWAPFFDDVNAIIFLAPISAFDEKLAENPRVNRLEDSFLLWKAVVSNKLLCKTQVSPFRHFAFSLLGFATGGRKSCADLRVRLDRSSCS